MPGNAGVYGTEPMTVRPPFPILCRSWPQRGAREREAAAGSSERLFAAARSQFKKGFLRRTELYTICPGRKPFMFFEPSSGRKTVFQKMGVTRPRFIMSPASDAICFGGSGASLFSQASISPMQPDTRKE